MASGSITPRGKNFRVRVDYRDMLGRRRQVSKTAASKRQAEKLRTALLAEVDQGTFVKPSKITVGIYLEQWLKSQVRSTVSPSTYELYEIITKKHLTPVLGTIPLGRLRPQHIQALYAEKLQQGLSARTVQLQHVCLHKALDNAVKTGLLARNPIDAVTQPKVERHEIKTMTEEDISRFLNEARKGEYYALFFTLLFTGIRRGEAISLRWSDVDLLGCQLSINKTMQFLKNMVTFKTPKTASSRRQIALSPSTCVVLRLYREARNNVRQSVLKLPPLADNDLVFSHHDGSPYLPNSITHAWIKLVRHCGLNGVRLHDARHTHASLMLKNGTNPKIIQERLGHSTFAITMNLYAHVSPGMQKQAANLFDEMVIGASKDESVTIT